MANINLYPFGVGGGDASGNQGVALPATIIETNEDGFYIVDENLNIGAFFTATEANILLAGLSENI